MTLVYENSRFRIRCACGFEASGYTLEGAGRDYDVHLAEKEPLGSKRAPCVAADGAADLGVQYRCLWEEYIGGAGWVPMSGPVLYDINPALGHQARLLADPKMRRVSVEARAKSDRPWPRPWEVDERGSL